MFVRKLPYIIYRDYPTNGYLTDNRNFGYDTANKSCLKVGDLLMSKEGSVFYSQLKDEFQSVHEIVCKLTHMFKSVSFETILEDANTFYKELSNKGFAVCVEKIEDGVMSPCYMSYDNIRPCLIDIEHEVDTKYGEIFPGNYNLSRVHIDIASRCNENCVHCYIPLKNKCSLMTTNVFDKVLSQCISMKVLNVTLSGGEPMLNPNLKSYIIKCIEANFSINILSNLTYLTDELLDLIASNPLISVQTSLYAMNEETHDLITRKNGSFRKTLHAIKQLHERNVPMQINCPIMKQNLMCYRAVLDFATSLNIEASADYALFGCYDSSGRNLGCRICTADVAKILEEDYRNANTITEVLRVMDLKKTGNEDSICSVCKSSLCVANNGDVYPCEGWQRMILGNINSESLQSIWEDKPLTMHLRDLKYRDFMECKVCKNRKFCSTCLIMNANETNNDYMTVNPYLCELANIKRQAIEKLCKYM